MWCRLTFSISIAVVFGVIVEVFGVIVLLSVTFLVKAAFKRLLFGLEEAIFELIRGDCLIFLFDILSISQATNGRNGIFLFFSAMFLKIFRLNRANEV